MIAWKVLWYPQRLWKYLLWSHFEEKNSSKNHIFSAVLKWQKMVQMLFVLEHNSIKIPRIQWCYAVFEVHFWVLKKLSLDRVIAWKVLWYPQRIWIYLFCSHFEEKNSSKNHIFSAVLKWQKMVQMLLVLEHNWIEIPRIQWCYACSRYTSGYSESFHLIKWLLERFYGTCNDCENTCFWAILKKKILPKITFLVLF